MTAEWRKLLQSLFPDAYDAQDFFEAWLRERPGVDLHAVPWHAASTTVMRALVVRLNAAGYLKGDLLDALATELPGQRDRIDALRQGAPQPERSVPQSPTAAVEPPDEPGSAPRVIAPDPPDPRTDNSPTPAISDPSSETEIATATPSPASVSIPRQHPSRGSQANAGATASTATLAQSMSPKFSNPPGPNELIERLDRPGGRPVVFLVGSALTKPIAGSPGVADTEAMVKLVGEYLTATPSDADYATRMKARDARESFDAALARVDRAAQYQEAFKQIKIRGGADAMNEVIRAAVLGARTDGGRPPLDDTLALAKLEASPDGWYLGRAVKALGLLIARHPARFGSVVLTTNFDPLVEVAIRAAGRSAMAIDKLGDGGLSTPDPTVTGVVHLHGLWRTDTLHTPGALTVPRPALEHSLADLCKRVTLVVLAYGGWDDVLMKMLARISKDPTATPDVLWCFKEREETLIQQSHAHVLALLGSLRERSMYYTGIDCNEMLPMLRARLDDECELLGRSAVLTSLLDALDGEHPVEILGEPYMGGESLLDWVERRATSCLQTALVNARELAEPTPVALVRKVAALIGHTDIVERELLRVRAVPGDDDAARALKLLAGTWILIKNAEAFAVPGHGFTKDFFTQMRAALQERTLHWISVSSVRLGALFESVGLTSRFLNDAVPIHAGGLDRREVEVALEARFGAEAGALITMTGTLPALVERVCSAEWSKDRDEVLSNLLPWSLPLFERWWARDAMQQDLLRRVVDGVALTALDEQGRIEAGELCKRGLLVETTDGYGLNGALWRAYVRGR